MIDIDFRFNDASSESDRFRRSWPVVPEAGTRIGLQAPGRPDKRWGVVQLVEMEDAVDGGMPSEGAPPIIRVWLGDD